MLPVLSAEGAVTYCQRRYLHPPEGRSKYDNPAAALGTNPRVGWVRAPRPVHRILLVVCEGLPDAYTAAAAGLPAAALLGAAYPDERVADELVQHLADRRLIVAFDANEVGRAGASRLEGLLVGRGVEVLNVCPPERFVDLNGWARAEPRWASCLGAPAPGLAGDCGPEPLSSPTLG